MDFNFRWVDKSAHKIIDKIGFRRMLIIIIIGAVVCYLLYL